MPPIAAPLIPLSMRSSKRVRTQHWSDVSPPGPQPVTTTSGCRRKVTIETLPSEVLLNIFLHCLDVSPQCWPTLVHVCQNWRQIVFTSPLTLHLRLYCKHGTPVLKTLGYWPALPIVVQYGGSPTLDPPSPEDEVNIVAALNESDRVSSISLTITSSLLEKFFFIEETFSNLEDLVLLSQNPIMLALPSAFKWGSRLRHLQLTGIAFLSLSQLLSHSLDLVDLQLHEIPSVGYFSPGDFTSALSGMTRLQSLSLHFLSPASRPIHIDLSPSPGERVVLPALTHLKFRGTSEYLNSFVTSIDAPSLVDIEVRFFNQLVFHLSQLRRFIDRIEIQKLHRRAEIKFSGHAVSITFTQPESHARLTLQISCEHLDWQLSSIAQVCDNLSPLLSSVQDLGIGTTTQQSVAPIYGLSSPLLSGAQNLDIATTQQSIAPIYGMSSPLLSGAQDPGLSTTQQSMAPIYGLSSLLLSGAQDLDVDTTQQSVAPMYGLPSPFLPNVQDLGIGTTQRPSGMDDVDGEQWLELIRAFDGTEDFRVASELTIDILRALRPVSGEHTTVLPALRNLRIPGLVSIHGPLREAVESFATSRRLSGHPVQVYPPSPVLGADKKTPGIPRKRFHCNICDISFTQRQGFNRHNKDKHAPRNMCAFCSDFQWTVGRSYLYSKHLKSKHPGVQAQVSPPEHLS
ncbi:hypothetical protein EDB92DRAFT_484548 [Lactarius akahatsu]|uniref:C2H2-type domain-containing protein n=1 Tax=Lactarius akahatsu TaxID=416441 RepID=A0AAD4LQM5_9AGAM|nr:hypothetical protein EDB92DRAFT_484548 [Lactarius akahatsu]